VKNNKLLSIVLFLVLLTVDLLAIDGKVKVYIKKYNEIYTSQKVTLVIELMTNAFSISDARIIVPASSKYIVQVPKSADYLRTVDINDTDWQLVHYEYQVYTLRAGEITIASIPISFSASMGYGQPKKVFDLQSEILRFKVKSPQGVKEGQFVLVTDNYTLESEVKPAKKQLIVGDAVEVKITQKASGVLDILLKPFVYNSNEKVRVYDKEPELKSGLKGGFDVSRTDSFTFVATAEGNVTVAVQEAVWWNAQVKKVQKETIPAMIFEVIADPQIAIDAKKAEQKRILGYLVLFSVLLLLFYRLYAPSLKRWLHHRKKVYEESEEGRFKGLLEACQGNDVNAIYHAFYVWLELASPKLSRLGFRGIEEVQPSFSVSLRELEAVLSVREQSFDKMRFISEVKKLRERLLKEQQHTEQGLPSTINPKG